MSGFVEEVKPIDECLSVVSDALGFPWNIRTREVSLADAYSLISSEDIAAPEPSPPFTRSLRDGYAVRSSDTTGASAGAPVFLRMCGDVVMGAAPNFALCENETVAGVPTGGMIPEGADAVVMIEDTAPAGDWIEVRRAVQRGENVSFAGEEVEAGEVIIRRGERISRAALGTIAAFGVASVNVFDLRAGVISTGDEVVGTDVSPLPLGCVRDANSHITTSVLREYGWYSSASCGEDSFPKFYGIARDSIYELGKLVDAALSECDVLLLSGGSSVGARDYTISIMERLNAPGLLVRGINMTPGKPTLIGGDAANRKLMVGLPGHPLSCMVASLFVTAPLLLAMIGSGRKHEGKYLNLPAGEDVHGRTGPDEFIPMRLDGKFAVPLAAKSGYVSAMMSSRGGSDGFIRMRPNAETLRRGEIAEVWMW